MNLNNTKRTKCSSCGNYMNVNINGEKEYGECKVCKAKIFRKWITPNTEIIKIKHK